MPIPECGSRGTLNKILQRSGVLNVAPSQRTKVASTSVSNLSLDWKRNSHNFRGGQYALLKKSLQSSINNNKNQRQGGIGTSGIPSVVKTAASGEAAYGPERPKTNHIPEKQKIKLEKLNMAKSRKD